MKKLLLFLVALFAPVGAFAQLPAPTITLNPSQNGNTSTFVTTVIFVFDNTGDSSGSPAPAGSLVCYTTNGTLPTASTPGTCGTGSTSYNPNPPGGIPPWLNVYATGTVINAITTQAGQTNSSLATSGPLTIYAPAPQFSLSSGQYNGAQTLTIIAPPGVPTPTAPYSVCYTTDGSTPTAPTAGACSGGTTQTYSSPISLSVGTDEVISAMITSSTLTNGPVVANVYTVLVSRPSQTWYVRPDGGTRYSNNATEGQCNGMFDASYTSTGGTGVNQNCAFNDVRYLWQDSSYTYGYDNGVTTSIYPGWGWVIAGGDTVIIRGSIGTGVSYRVGWNNGTTYCDTNGTCFGVTGDPSGSGAPPPPSGTSAHPTQILGENYSSCTSPSAKTQIHGGYQVGHVFGLGGSAYVNLECLDLTDFSECAKFGTNPNTGEPDQYPAACGSGDPYNDYAAEGITTDSITANILFQDLNIHGFTDSGLQGSIGGLITMSRMSVNFNGFSGWNFDNGEDIPNNPSASIVASYVTMKGNGCNEEYPIVDAFPAVSCYDALSGGFGDSWSGQDTPMASFTCDHCQMIYNTKDGFIGPHVEVSNLSVTNSMSYGNSGQEWKWGSANNSTEVFENNITGGNCNRMSQPLPGAPSNYNQFLSDFCRASADGFIIQLGMGENLLVANNTYYGYNLTTFSLNCNIYGTCGAASLVFRNNIFLGYTNPNFPGSDTQSPGLYYPSDSSVTWTADHNIEWGVRNGQCGTPTYPNPNVGTTLCASPQLIAQPIGNNTTFVESELDNFNPGLLSTSPAIGTGEAISGLTVDFNGATYSSPPPMGAFMYGSVSPLSTITVTPANNAAATAGGTTPMSASCFYSNGMTLPCSVMWSSTGAHSSVGSTTGVVTGASAGIDTVTATISTVEGSAAVTISGPAALFYQFQGITLLGRHN